MDGIPGVYYFGPFRLQNALVMDRLGCSLEALFEDRQRRFTLKTVAMLAKRMVCISCQPRDA